MKQIVSDVKNLYRTFSNWFVSALANRRTVMRTMAGDSRNLLQTWIDSDGNCMVFSCHLLQFAQKILENC
jgi:hypothetical protein